MGIDVYLEWKRQGKAEKKAQITGYSVVHGHAGYLREAYHGSPYATQVLVPEGWDDREDDPCVPAAVLRERLAATVLTALYRQHVVYDERLDDPGVIVDIGNGDGLAALGTTLASIFDDFAGQREHSLEVGNHWNEEQLKQAEELIRRRALPGYALSFVDFVDLAERKERETGEPCKVHVSA